MNDDNIRETARKEAEGSVPGSARIEIPIYESFKGKQMHGHKTWSATEKEQKTVKLLGVIFAVMVVLALVSFFLPIPGPAKVLLFVLAILAGIGGMGGYLFYIAFRHHKEDPIEMHYYDVDYRRNHLTGNVSDNTREISKEEFFSSKRNETGSKAGP